MNPCNQSEHLAIRRRICLSRPGFQNQSKVHRGKYPTAASRLQTTLAFCWRFLIAESLNVSTL
ncbi:Uncharacterised protein [Vibrio cholerae]|nr:Uncharacterised protein [Vibrio cholerae]